MTSFRVRVMDRVRVRVRDPSLKSGYGFQVASIKLIYIRIIVECDFLQKDFRTISAYN